MGLFDFARNIGKRIFSNDDEAAEKLKAHIEADNPGMKDLTVEYTDGVAKISGQAKDSAALEKAVLMAGNVEGVGEVQLGEVSGAEPSENVSYYEIQSGDSLWKIAEKAYGNGSQYTKIFEENKEVIKDPDLIYPGQKIRIPNA